MDGLSSCIQKASNYKEFISPLWKGATHKQVYTNQNANVKAVAMATRQHFAKQQMDAHNHNLLYYWYNYFLTYVIVLIINY